MKLVSFFSRVAAVATTAFLLAVLFDHYVAAFFGIAASSFFLLIVAKDYAPKSRRWEPRLVPVHEPRPRSPDRHRFRLAA